MRKGSEYQEQCAIFRWAKMQERTWPELALLNASLNGVKLNIGQAVKAKAQGMRAGYPDMFLPVKRGPFSGLFIELKYGKNKATAEQEWWLQALANQGFSCCVCWGADQAIEAIRKYMLG